MMMQASPHERPCGGPKLRVHFYDVAQALAALVDLPNGRHILVDTGDKANRAGCGTPCKTAHQHLMDGLKTDLGGAPIDLLWITHQHSDHIGGAIDVVDTFNVKAYVDNGLNLGPPAEDGAAQIKDTRGELATRGVAVHVVDTQHPDVPLTDTGDVKVTAIVPSNFDARCTKPSGDDRNLCSIMLRVDYCDSSVLLTGDEETGEEALFPHLEHADLLQAGHHGSNTSSGAAFLASVKPRYVVVSAGKPDEGSNKGYCHPSRSTIDHLTAALGGAGGQKLAAFDGASCAKGVSHLSQFVDVPTSDRLWATEQDGDVVLTTTGDGTFTRE
jgi:competence protein ComEC